MPTITDFSQMTDSAIKKLFAEAPKIPVNELAKVGIATATGLTYYDLQAPAKNLFPVITPLRNKIPRVAGNGGPATNWVSVTNINANNLHASVPEGRRNGVLSVTAAPHSATYKRAGLEQTVTKEAELAGQNFEDVRATSAQRELWALMIEEELKNIGGNNGLALGTPATPVVTHTASGGSVADGTYLVYVVLLTYFGYRDSSVASGVATTVSVTNPNNFTFTYKAGSSLPSLAGSSSAISTGSANNILHATATWKPGTCGFAWYVDDGAGGAATLQAITTINSVTLSALTTTHQNVTAITADNSQDDMGYDGFFSQAWASGSNAYVKTLATGTPGTGTPLTASGKGTITEIDTMLQDRYDNYRLIPNIGYCSSQEINNIATKLLTRTQSSTQIQGVQYFTELEGGEYVLNVGISRIKYQSLLGQPLDIVVHPYMPQGTMMFVTDVLPYPINNVSNVYEMKLRRDYYQVAWPLREETYEFGVYFDGVLAHYFPPSLAILNNIANG